MSEPRFTPVAQVPADVDNSHACMKQYHSKLEKNAIPHATSPAPIFYTIFKMLYNAGNYAQAVQWAPLPW